LFYSSTLVRIHAVRLPALLQVEKLTANSMNPDQTTWIRRLVWIHAGRKRTMLVLSWRGSYDEYKSILKKNKISWVVFSCKFRHWQDFVYSWWTSSRLLLQIQLTNADYIFSVRVIENQYFGTCFHVMIKFIMHASLIKIWTKSLNALWIGQFTRRIKLLEWVTPIFISWTKLYRKSRMCQNEIAFHIWCKWILEYVWIVSRFSFILNKSMMDVKYWVQLLIS
jgi:hypothetical protein